MKSTGHHRFQLTKVRLLTTAAGNSKTLDLVWWQKATLNQESAIIKTPFKKSIPNVKSSDAVFIKEKKVTKT